VLRVFERLSGYPDDVVAIRGTGRISAADYRTVRDPAIAQAPEGGRRPRLLLVLAEGFEGYDAGAILADTETGVRGWHSFERIAVVTDTDWLRGAVHLFGPLIPGDVRAFPGTGLEEASSWIRG
jgi:hypothetical protein